jgi:hypothetical protein
MQPRGGGSSLEILTLEASYLGSKGTQGCKVMRLPTVPLEPRYPHSPTLQEGALRHGWTESTGVPRSQKNASPLDPTVQGYLAHKKTPPPRTLQ